MEKYTGSLICDWLQVLHVPFTDSFSERQFSAMPFQSLFGFSKLLDTYGIKSEGWETTDKTLLPSFPTPFIAEMNAGLVIVTSVTKGEVEYISQGAVGKIPVTEFEKAWTGRSFYSFPTKESTEPDYVLHASIEQLKRARKWVMWGAFVIIAIYFFISNGIFSHIPLVLATLVIIFGLYLSFLLVQKTAGISSRHADRVCGVIQQGGCDKVLSTDASSFFGLFHWSDVGLSYFSVSLMALLVFPSSWHAVALLNVLCLPFSFWSVWYQKYRAHHWCTLCLGVQATLWLMFICFLTGGWLDNAFRIDWTVIILALAYTAVTLASNFITDLIKKQDNEN